MKIVTYLREQELRLGVPVSDEHLIDLRRAAARYLVEAEKNSLGEELARIRVPPDMAEFLNGGDLALDLAKRAIDFAKNAIVKAGQTPEFFESKLLVHLDSVRLLSPVPRPGALICAGKNFSDHVGEMSGRKPPARPVAFLKMPHTIIGPYDDIFYPRETEKLDYEVEMAVVIGRPCKAISKEEVFDYVAGYMVLNDISARDIARKENLAGIMIMAKNFTGFSPMGPSLVLKDEISDPQHLKLQSRVNGEVRQDSDLDHMIFKLRDIISYWSQMGLHPGDVLSTGTPRGVAAGRKESQTPWWLKPGDVVEAEVEKLGCLRNRIVREDED
jgi:acylpyruvate hydrolase